MTNEPTTSTRDLRNPIEYYEALVGRGPWCSYYPQFAIRLDNETRWQQREHELATDDLRSKRNS
jgi:hypothetical protein